MKLSILASLFLAGTAMAAGGLPNGHDCKADGSMGNCQSTFCDAQGGKVGKCQPKN